MGVCQSAMHKVSKMPYSRLTLSTHWLIYQNITVSVVFFLTTATFATKCSLIVLYSVHSGQSWMGGGCVDLLVGVELWLGNFIFYIIQLFSFMNIAALHAHVHFQVYC